MFRITASKGFQITFKNGVTVSVQFGVGNYCEHHHDDLHLIGKESDVKGGLRSGDAEIAIWKEDGECWITAEFSGTGEAVLGWQSPKEVLAALTWAAARA